jgi:hypothetical protein
VQTYNFKTACVRFRGRNKGILRLLSGSGEQRLYASPGSRDCVQTALATKKQDEIRRKTAPTSTRPGTLQGEESASRHSQVACIARQHPHSSQSSPPKQHLIHSRSFHWLLQILLGNPHILCDQRKPCNPLTTKSKRTSL